jgi:flagellar hook-associated protein 2
MAGLTLGGLVSGLDTDAVIAQLMAIDSQSQTRLKLREAAETARRDALTDVGSRLRSLDAAAKSLGSTSSWIDTQTIDVSDATKLSARRTGGAAPGGHELVVANLARAEQRSYAYTAADTTLSFTTAAGTTSVALTAADDGQAAADKINSTAGVPVYAVWVKDPAGVAANDRLVLTRKDTGNYAATDMTVTGASWASTETRQAGANASYTIDGVAGSSMTNVLTAAIPGVELTLKAAGTTAVTVSAPGPDPNVVKDQVKAFVDQYNSTIDFIQGKLAEKPVVNATTTTDARKGALYGDSQLTSLLSQMRQMVSDPNTALGGAIKSFGDLGITTGAATGDKSSADSLAGKLTIDDAKLTAALQDKRLDVKAFLTDAVNGISTRFSAIVSPVSRVEGILDQRRKASDDEIKSIDDDLAASEERLTLRTERLRQQFAAMEAAMASAQSQGQWLGAQLAGLR